MRRILSLVSTAAVMSATGWVGAVPASAAFPTGFTDVVIANPAGNPLTGPTGITAMPDGRALITQKGGAVRVLLADGTIAAADAVTLAVCTDSEEGLLGAAVDPAFTSNGFVYLFYTHDAGNCGSPTGRFNRVSRFMMTGNTIVAASERVMLDKMNIPAGNHNGGNLEIGGDGDLYVSVGDGGTNSPRGASAPVAAAQDLSLLNGKILRLTLDGGVPADNPFVGDANGASCATAGVSAATTTRCTEIYDYGLRNPYRFAFDPNAGNSRFFINDVGESTWEEVDQGGKGLNYGWKSREGYCNVGSTTNCPPTPAGFTDPLTDYPHSIGCSFITAGAFVPNGVWPSQFNGSYLFADGGCGKVFAYTAAGKVDYSNPFAQTSGVIVDMTFVTQGASTALFYVTYGDSKLHKVQYQGSVDPIGTSKDFVALAPARLADTRTAQTTVDAQFAGTGTMTAGTTMQLIVAGRGGVAATATAAALNVTATNSVGTGFVTVYPCGAARPTASNLNSVSGSTVPNAVVTKIGSLGSVCIYVQVDTDLVVDVDGYVPPGSSVIATLPARVLDTRVGFTTVDGVEQGGGQRSASSVTPVQITGRAGVPDDASAVILDLTATDPTAAGYATVYPCGTQAPTASNINYVAGSTVADLAVTKIGSGGQVCIFSQSAAQFVVDVDGFLSSAASYAALVPARLLDTRSSASTIDGQSVAAGVRPLGTVTTLQVSGRGGVPTNATAVVLNVTVTGPVAAGFATVYPCGMTTPLASNLNFLAGQTVANASIVQLGSGGTVCLYNSQPTDLVVDVDGAFTS